MARNKFTPFIIGVIVLLLSGIITVASQPRQYRIVVSRRPTTSTTTNNTQTTTTKPTSYTLAQVSTHNSPSNCWTAINGSVYDVTSWIGQHPGGAEAIIILCGIDGSDAYNGQHGGQRRPANELAMFKIGELAQ